MFYNEMFLHCQQYIPVIDLCSWNILLSLAEGKFREFKKDDFFHNVEQHCVLVFHW